VTGRAALGGISTTLPAGNCFERMFDCHTRRQARNSAIVERPSRMTGAGHLRLPSSSHSAEGRSAGAAGTNGPCDRAGHRRVLKVCLRRGCGVVGEEWS
jgi:hypothetical protein